MHFAWLAGCSSSDTKRMSLMIACTAARPRPSSTKPGSESGFHYDTSAASWLHSKLFFAWLTRHETYFKRTLSRKWLLFLSSCSAPVRKDNISPIKNFCVECSTSIMTIKIIFSLPGLLRWGRVEIWNSQRPFFCKPSKIDREIVAV